MSTWAKHLTWFNSVKCLFGEHLRNIFVEASFIETSRQNVFNILFSPRGSCYFSLDCLSCTLLWVILNMSMTWLKHFVNILFHLKSLGTGRGVLSSLLPLANTTGEKKVLMNRQETSQESLIIQVMTIKVEVLLSKLSSSRSRVYDEWLSIHNWLA